MVLQENEIIKCRYFAQKSKGYFGKVHLFILSMRVKYMFFLLCTGKDKKRINFAGKDKKGEMALDHAAIYYVNR